MTTPSDSVNDYINARVPMPKNSQQEGERYNAENEDGNNDEYRKRREEEEEEDVSRETFEKNAREAEREIEYNSQRELDDLEQSEPDYEEDNRLEDDAFTGNYFAQPDESEEKSSRLGDRIRAKYDSFRASASDTAENLASSFGESFGASFGAAAGAASRFKRGDPIFSMRQPAKRGKNPYTRSISRPGRSISRPYVGGRFDNSLTLGANGGYNPYYPVNEGRQSTSPQPMDMYLPSGGAYEGEFFGRKTFKESRFNDQDNYDPFGFGKRLAGDGFKNTEKFGTSLMGFESDLFGGGAGNDTVFGSIGKTGKMNILGDSGMFAIGDLVSPPAVRKTTTKRKSASSKTTKKPTRRKQATRKQATRKQPHNGFALP